MTEIGNSKAIPGALVQFNVKRQISFGI